MQPRIRILVGVALVSLILAVMPSSALADCSSPDGVEGEVVYNADYKVVQYCNGSHWALMGGSTLDARIGALNAGKWCAANGAGDKIDCTADAPTTVVGSDKQVIFNDGGTALAGAAQLFWDKANNRFGIGTTGPANPLDVVGSGTNFQIRFRSSGNEGGIGADPNGFFRVVGDAGGALGYGSASSNTFTEVLRINNSGNVGIGTASPAASSLLDITSTTKGFLSPRMTTAQRDAIASPATGLMIYNTTNAQFEFFNGTAWSGIGSMTMGQIAAFASATCPTGWTEYTPARGRFLRGIDNGAGNDPSGTRAPGNVQADELASHTHTITDNGVALKVYDQTGNAGGSYGTVARPDAGGSVSARRDMVIGNAGGAETRPKNVAVIFCQYSGGGNVAPASATVSGTANYVAKFTGPTVVGDSQIFDNGTNVGIGTTSPAAPLDIYSGMNFGLPQTTGTGKGGANTKFAWSGGDVSVNNGLMGNGTSWLQVQRISDNSDTFPFVINPNGGNVGIGTASPDTKLEVSGVPLSGNAPGLQISNSGTGQLLNMGLWYGGVANGWIDANGPLLLQPGGGNVGIGTTAPGWKLHIADAAAPVIEMDEGDTGGKAFIGVDGNNLFIRRGTIGTADAMTVTAGGNVGIGITPAYPLDVKDALRVLSTTTWPVIHSDGSVAAGTHPGYFIARNSRAGAHLQANDFIGVFSFRSSVAGVSADIVAQTPETQTNTSTPGALILRTTPSGSAAPLDRMRIDQNGNVGIGTASPGFRLDVALEGGSTVIASRSYGASNFTPHFIGYKARGTASATSYPLNGDPLASFQGRSGHGVASWPGMTIHAAEDFSATAQGSAIGFATVTQGTITATERMRIDQNGNVGIGTATPAAPMHVIERTIIGTAGTSGTQQVAVNLVTLGGSGGNDLSAAGTRGWSLYGRGNAYSVSAEQNDLGLAYWNGSTWRIPLNIDSATGNVGIGTASPDAALDIASATQTANLGGAIRYKATAGSYAGIALDAPSPGASKSLYMHYGDHVGGDMDNQLRFGRYADDFGVWEANPYVFDMDAPNATIYVAHNGYVGVGTANPQYMLDVGGTARVLTLRGGAGSNFHIDANDSTRSIYLNWYSTGDVYARNTLLASSDERLKQNIAVLPNALERIARIRGVSFEWKDSARPGRQVGVIAQDVEKVFPELVNEDQDGFKTVAYSNMIAPLIEAVKELKAANDNQAEAMEKLRAEFDAYRAAHP